jgi:hypothetical protein
MPWLNAYCAAATVSTSIAFSVVAITGAGVKGARYPRRAADPSTASEVGLRHCQRIRDTLAAHLRYRLESLDSFRR